MNQTAPKGFWIPDRFLDDVKGHSRLERLARDASVGFHSEVEGISNGLFPFRDVPVPARPGYITHERDYFVIDHPNQNVKKHLEEYLLGRFHKDGLYSHGHDLAGFLDMAAKSVLIEGKTFYRIEWGDEEVGGATYKLPKNLMYLPFVTIKKTRTGYLQKYSFFTYLFDTNFRNHYEGSGKRYPRKYRFGVDEILKLGYLEDASPVMRSSKYVAVFENFWQYGLNHSRGGAEPENQSLSIERTRYTTFAIEKRKYDLAKAKVAKIFNYIPTGTGKDFGLTEYYDIYTATRYIRFLCRLRDKLVNDFSDQVLGRIGEKNNFSPLPRLQMRYLMTEARVDEIFELYSSGRIDNQKCIKLLFKNY